jgi:hypothetical protein
MMPNRYATVNPAANAGLVEGMKGLFNPVDTISRQFKAGMMGEGILGYEEINMSQSIKQHTCGTRTATGASVNGNASEGASTITLSSAGNALTFAVGDVFTVADCYSVNPQTRESTGSLQQFVVTEANTSTAGGAVTLKVSPALYSPSHALATVSTLTITGKAVVFVGAASSQYPQNMIYHKDAISFATADLLLPQGVDMASRQVHNGISMRIVRQYDINNDRLPCRIDVLYGYSVIRPQMAARLWG